MSVKETFVQWYQKLSSEDQTTLSGFLVQKFCALPMRSASPQFRGRQVGPVGSGSSAKVECPYCHNQIEM